MKKEDLEYFRGKKILITGHTGFKGSWLCEILTLAGAHVTGYALKPPTEPNLFGLAGLEERVDSVQGDVRDLPRLMETFDRVQPEIVIHLAAQPIVRQSYRDPVGTYETNVMGTVHICEAVRRHASVKSFLNVTTDKVYQNKEWCWGYRENEPLDGFDPYSNSKSCSELVTHSYIRSFYGQSDTAVSTARAGNVIGGGDFAPDRIIPDCVRSLESGRPLLIRNPDSTRPYQHVLEPLSLYLTIVKEQEEDRNKAGFYNVGPDDADCVSTGELVEKFRRYWGEDFRYEIAPRDPAAVHEANFLKLDCSKIRQVFGWKPVWGIDQAIEKTTEWTRVYLSGGDVRREMDREITEFFS